MTVELDPTDGRARAVRTGVQEHSLVSAGGPGGDGQGDGQPRCGRVCAGFRPRRPETLQGAPADFRPGDRRHSRQGRPRTHRLTAGLRMGSTGRPEGNSAVPGRAPTWTRCWSSLARPRRCLTQASTIRPQRFGRLQRSYRGGGEPVGSAARGKPPLWPRPRLNSVDGFACASPCAPRRPPPTGDYPALQLAVPSDKTLTRSGLDPTARLNGRGCQGADEQRAGTAATAAVRGGPQAGLE